VVAETRRAQCSYALTDASGTVRSGNAEAVIEDDGLIVGPVAVAFLDADALSTGDYRIELSLWPDGRLMLSQLGRRFDTFAQELRGVRNQARVAGLLAHGITMPIVFAGALLSGGGQRSAEFQVYDTHLTVVPDDGDPWQVPFGAITDVRSRSEPPGVVLDSTDGLTILGQLGRQREACETAIVERRTAQQRALAELTGQAGFSDGWSIARSHVREFTALLERFTAPERTAARDAILAAATGDPRVGFVQLLDPDGERLRCPASLPENLATFLLVPVGSLTVLEILAGPAAATYMFRGAIDAVNRDLQLLHFRRAPLALTEEQAALTPANPHRLALRRLAPLGRLRASTVARLIHREGWDAAFRSALTAATAGAS
jgi:hypothetical protein